MCQKCDDLDYPVAECWRPCYVPRTPAPRLPRLRSLSDEDIDRTLTIQRLLSQLKAQRQEIDALKAMAQPDATPRRFEGVEG